MNPTLEVAIPPPIFQSCALIVFGLQRVKERVAISKIELRRQKTPKENHIDPNYEKIPITTWMENRLFSDNRTTKIEA